MNLRDKLRSRVAAHLPGEEVQEVFTAQTGPSPWLLALLGVLPRLLWCQPRIVAVTPRAVVVLDADWTGTRPRRVRARLARQTRIGPMSGLWGRTHLGEQLWVPHRFHADVRLADRVLMVPPLVGTTASSPVEPSDTTDPTPAAPIERPVPVGNGGRPAWQYIGAGMAATVLIVSGVAVWAEQRQEADHRRVRAYAAGAPADTFESHEGDFTVDFPVDPFRREQEYPDVGLVEITYLAEVSLDDAFIVSTAELPDELYRATPVEQQLDNTIHGMALASRGTVLEISEREVLGRRGLEGTIEVHGSIGTADVHHLRVVVVLEEQRMYAISAVGVDVPGADFERFLASFRLAG